MKQEEFSLALNALLPGCDPEAASKWAEFAPGCVEQGQYAHFIPAERDAAVGMWLDAIYAGLYAVKREHGTEVAAKVAGLSCHKCALYPGEMMQAARAIEIGGGAEEVRRMMENDELDAEKPFFFDFPDGAALTCQGPEIKIFSRLGLSCSLFQSQKEPGYELLDGGTVLLESKRDSFGRYLGGVEKDGTFHPTERLYAPVRDEKGEIKAFQEVKPVTARERESAFLAGESDAIAIYRLKVTPPPEGYVPLARLQKSGESPMAGNYGLIYIAPLSPGADQGKTLDAYQKAFALNPCDIAVFKQGGAVTCWFVNQYAYSKMPGLLENAVNEVPKPSVMENLRKRQKEAGKPQNGTDSPLPRRDPER